MSTIGWSNVGRSSGSGDSNKVNWLKIFAGGEVIIRPVGEPEELIKYFVKIGPNDKGRSAITEVNGKSCIIQRKYQDDEGKPLYRQQVKYAINCIDRADGQLKVLEMPRSVALDIRDWGEENNSNPGGPKGCDWKIKSVKTGPDPRDVEYKLFNRDRTPFTDDELKVIENVYDLKKLFAPTPQDQIEEKLGLVPSKDSDSTASAPAAAPVAKATTQVGASAEEELSF